MTESSSPVALVTGASRGIGAALARYFAQRGVDLVLNYRSKGSRAEAVAAQVREYGRRALLVQADLTIAAEREAMAAQIAATYRRLDLLVLNASGGLEKDKPASYAMQLNRDAQLGTVDACFALLRPGGRIVFVTSHMAHFYGVQPVLDAYAPVASSKRAGEDALRARIPTFAERSLSLIVVSGDVIEGTITPKLLEREVPGMVAARRNQVGSLPTVETFAHAIVDAALDSDLPSGHTVFVGSTEIPLSDGF
ncbi:MAG: SDR family oxidoreductase [Oscillochloris sp.]|nr:SDR family oxidoreductase [Oscillochloris sp.]